MYGELYQYLVLHKQLHVPGIGTFRVERKSADIDFANKLVNPPCYSVSLHQGQAPPSKKLFDWLASVFGISELDAVIRFNDFAFDLKDRVRLGHKLEWKGIGTLSKGLAGEIRFEPLLGEQPEGSPIPAIKVIRENAQHTVRVGEDEKTSGEMIELLNLSGRKRSYRWAAVLIIMLLTFIFIIYYFSVNGWNISSTANRQRISPTETAPSSKLIQ